MGNYVNVKDIFHILDFVMSDDSIKHKGKAIRKRLKELPEEDVEKVVRCKDCKHYEIHKPSVTLNCERDGRLIPMMPDDYCRYGVRKEGAENG